MTQTIRDAFGHKEERGFDPIARSHAEADQSVGPQSSSSPAFLERLEQYSMEGESPEYGLLPRRWLDRPGIRKFLSFGLVDKVLIEAWSRQYSMANFPSWKFAAILPSIPPPANPQPSAGKTPGTRVNPASSKEAVLRVSAADSKEGVEAGDSFNRQAANENPRAFRSCY